MVDFVVFVAAAAAAAVDMQPKQPNGRSCYGCIGWCTYGDLCKPPANVKWHDVATELGVQGQGWPAAEMANPYNRFPAKAKAIVPPAVWAKSQSKPLSAEKFSRGHWCGCCSLLLPLRRGGGKQPTSNLSSAVACCSCPLERRGGTKQPSICGSLLHSLSANPNLTPNPLLMAASHMLKASCRQA